MLRLMPRCRWAARSKAIPWPRTASVANAQSSVAKIRLITPSISICRRNRFVASSFGSLLTTGLEAQTIINRYRQFLLRPKIPLRSLDRRVPEQELDLENAVSSRRATFHRSCLLVDPLRQLLL